MQRILRLNVERHEQLSQGQKMMMILFLLLSSLRKKKLFALRESPVSGENESEMSVVRVLNPDKPAFCCVLIQIIND